MRAISSITLKPMASTFDFNPLSGQTSILVSWLVILILLPPRLSVLKPVFARTFQQMWGAFLVALFIFGFAYVFVFSGMAASLAYGLSKIGWVFVILSPVLGWIRGTFVRKQHLDQCNVWPGAGGDRKIVEYASPVIAFAEFGGRGSGQADRPANSQRRCLNQPLCA